MMRPADVLQWKNHIHGSPLYHQLADVIAADPDLMQVLNSIEHTPQPNVLLASVQYLLLNGASHRLRQYYASITEDPRAIEDVGPSFRDFVLEHQTAIVEMGRTRYTQTNEARRCVTLLPAVMSSNLTRFHLIDVGTSAGLNLAMDRYHYRWDGIEWGDRESPVRLDTEVRGVLPQLNPIDLLSRVGLDLHPVDAGDPDQRLWLDSLIWPEQHPRRERLRAALEAVAEVPIRFVAGDARDTLGDVLSSLPGDEPAVVINSFSMNQFGVERRRAVERVVADARRRRPVFRVSWEIFTSPNEWANLRVDAGAGWREIGQGDPHGAWVEFYA